MYPDYCLISSSAITSAIETCPPKTKACKRALKAVIALLALVSAGHAHAIPVPGLTGVDYALTDGQTSFEFTLVGGPVTGSEQNLSFAVGTNWRISVDFVIEDDFQPNRDRVVVIGEVFHQFEPHPPEGVGRTLGFTAIFDLGLPIQPGGGPRVEGVPDSRQHRRHSDIYGFTDVPGIGAPRGVIGGGPGGRNDITAWFIGIKGTHESRPIAEPSSMLLFGTGLAAFMLGLGRRVNCRLSRVIRRSWGAAFGVPLSFLS